MGITRSLPPTPTTMFKKNLPEFEELAAMESGYAWRPITVRRAGPQTVAKSDGGNFRLRELLSRLRTFAGGGQAALWMPTTRRAHRLPR